jgi:general secretion pathway protein D
MQVISSEDSPLTRILDDAQLKALLTVLERQAGTDLMAAPRVVTLSGRQTEISVVELRSVVAGIKPEALVNAGNPPGSELNSGPFRTTAIPCGPVLDLIPKVVADGERIELEVKFTLTEALSYAEDRASEQVEVWDHGRKTKVIAPIPRFRVRKMSATASLADGQTLVLLGGPAEDIVKLKDKVPVLGDLPIMGRLFRSEQEGRIQRRLFVMITAVQIDPAGNRLHPAVSAVAPASESDR